MKRRDFIRRTTLSAGALAAPMLIPRDVFAAAKKPGANDRIVIGIIGPGGRAHSLLSEAPEDVQLVALADCDLSQMEKYESWAAKECPKVVSGKLARYQDYRAMFEKENLDAVIVATTTHARALI